MTVVLAGLTAGSWPGTGRLLRDSGARGAVVSCVYGPLGRVTECACCGRINLLAALTASAQSGGWRDRPADGHPARTRTGVLAEDSGSQLRGPMAEGWGRAHVGCNGLGGASSAVIAALTSDPRAVPKPGSLPWIRGSQLSCQFAGNRSKGVFSLGGRPVPGCQGHA